MWLFDKDSKNFVRVPLPAKGRLYASPMPYGPDDPFNQLMINMNDEQRCLVCKWAWDGEEAVAT